MWNSGSFYFFFFFFFGGGGGGVERGGGGGGGGVCLLYTRSIYSHPLFSLFSFFLSLDDDLILDGNS